MVWNPWHTADIELLEKVQIRAVNQISGLTSNTYQEKLAELGLESLADRRKRTDLIQVYKIIYGFDRVDMNIWFQTCQQANIRNTRQNDFPHNLTRRKVSRTDVRQHFFSQRTINLWNNLPTHIKEAPTINSFKSLYDDYMTQDRHGVP